MVHRAGCVVLAMVLLAACGSAAPGNAPRTSRASTVRSASKPAPANVSFAFDFVPNGSQVGFWTAYKQGYYAAQGLNVHFVHGTSANATADAVATGKVDMALVSSGAVAELATKGAALRMVAVTVQGNPFGLVFLANRPILKPQGVYGKSIGVAPGTDADLYWKVFVNANHLHLSRIHVVNVSPSSQVGLLAKGHLAAYSAAGFAAIPALERLGVKVGSLSYASNGAAGGIGTGVVASLNMLKHHPDVVRRFLYASAQGFAFGARHPNAAGASILGAAPNLNQAQMTESFKLALEFLHSPATKGKPWGWQASSDWKHQIGILTRFAGLKKPLPIDRYYTNAYLPQTAP